MHETSKSHILAAERQEPCTAAEHAEAQGHGAEFIRDVPRTCICTWQWRPAERRYHLIRWWNGCPWHADEASAFGIEGLW